MKLTIEILNKGRSKNGSFSEEQLRLFNTTSVNNGGWYNRLIGQDFPEETIIKFIKLKDTHLDGLIKLGGFTFD